MALQLVGIGKRFGAHTALDDVHVHVREGDVYGFLGHNGAGKTTAMRIALGLMRADEGGVRIDGFDAAAHPAEARARLAGLIEVSGFHPHLSGRRNLLLLARLQGLSRAASKVEVDRVLEAVALTHAAERRVGGYSQGMRQRLGIAQALLGDPRYVLLDEPTNGLDPEGIDSIRTLLRTLNRERGVSFLVSSHQLHELEGLCNRIGILKQGRLLMEEETDVLLADDARRVELTTSDPDAARVTLERLGVPAHADRDRLVLEPGGRAANEVLAALVADGVPVGGYAPRKPDLEEVYFRCSATATTAAPVASGTGTRETRTPSSTSIPPASAPTEVRAPGHAIWRNARYELTRWASSPVVPIALLLPPLLAGVAVLLRWMEVTANQARVAGGTLASVTDMNAFEGVGVALQAGLLPLGFALGMIASQSLAGEVTRGTLRNVLLRPARRWQIALGKLTALGLLGLLGYLLLVGTASGVSAFLLDFGPVVEILPNGEPFELIPADELWPHLKSVLSAPLAAVACYGALGFLAGAVVRSGVAGLALATGFSIMLEVARVPARQFDHEPLLPSAYLPSPLSDTSVVASYLGHARGVSNAVEVATASPSVPLVWTAVALAVAIWQLGRRSVS